MFDRFTSRARKVLDFARKEAERLGHEYIGTEHILLGLIGVISCTAAKVLDDLGIDAVRIRQETERRVPPGAPAAARGNLPFTPGARRVVLEWAREEATSLGDDSVRTEHLLLALLRDASGITAQVLLGLGTELDEVRARLLESVRVNGPPTPDPFPPLDRNPVLERDDTAGPLPSALTDFASDLTALAAVGTLDPVVGRGGEIERIVRILRRRTGRVPVLVGPPGAGKTALVEGLAQALADRVFPPPFRGTRLFSLDLTWVAAVEGYRKGIEDGIRSMLLAAEKSPRFLLFLDHLEAVAPRNPAGAPSPCAALVLDALSRDRLRCILATTPEHHEAFLLRFPGFRPLLTPLLVRPLEGPQALDAVSAMRDRYARHHGVLYTDAALRAGVEFAARHRRHGSLLEFALALLDEAGAHVAQAGGTPPPAATDLCVRVRRLEAEILRQNRLKDRRVAQQDFEAAATVRDELARLRSAKDALDRALAGIADSTRGIVDATAVRAALLEMTGLLEEDLDAPNAKPAPAAPSPVPPPSTTAPPESPAG
ncbi:MAG: AAA family ATPase [Planctomycetes bacterium]|nr:AAA family ATPase [Planctomycetota bacterium]